MILCDRAAFSPRDYPNRMIRFTLLFSNVGIGIENTSLANPPTAFSPKDSANFTESDRHYCIDFCPAT
ncbi:hypothetical protein BCD67_11050 [Oscillatoriales cyanobacterium USR001]|nr:hypothetical protein BCD67_11050 [Oscillatoriales cyanobacterium USR001]